MNLYPDLKLWQLWVFSGLKTKYHPLLVHSSLELWAREKKCPAYLTMTQSFCIAQGSKWAINQNFWSRAFFCRDRLVFFPMLIRGKIQEKLALFMLWIAWNCVEMIPTDSHCSFAFATDSKVPKLLNSTQLYTQKLNLKAIIGNCAFFMRVMQKII